MAVAKGVQIDGLNELKATLGEGSRVAVNLMRSVTLGVAQEVAKRARSRAPVDSGTLKKAIKAKRGNPSNNGGNPFADVVVETGKGAKNDAFYWRFIEYGTRPSGDHPGLPESGFMLKSIESVRPEIPGIMREQFGKKIEQFLAKKAKKSSKKKG